MTNGCLLIVLGMQNMHHSFTGKAQWSADILLKGKELIKQGYSMRKAAKVLNIPISSLRTRLKNKDISEPRTGRLPVFTEDLEKCLADRIKSLSLIFYGLPATTIRKIAYQYAEDNCIKHNFDKRAQMAGYDWLQGFLGRNMISARRLNASKTFKSEDVQMFYKLLGELIEKHGFGPKDIYNCAETQVTTLHAPGKLSAIKGKKRVGTSLETAHLTLLCAVNADGSFVPPMFIFPRKRITPQLEKDGLKGAVWKCSDDGLVNEHLFFEWLQRFASHAQPSPQKPILLILDNHPSHISVRIDEFCEENDIHMLSLPPNASHIMQPLGTFFKQLKESYQKNYDLFSKNRQVEKITSYDVAVISNTAYSAVATKVKIETGFRVAGIVPYNPRVFVDENFVPHDH